MKNILNSLFTLFFFSLVSCSDHSPESNQTETYHLLAYTPTINMNSKLIIEEKSVVWSENDQFIAFDEKGNSNLYKLDLGAQTNKGTFVWDGNNSYIENLRYAAYPVSVHPKLENNKIEFTLPKSYQVEENSYMGTLPMFGEIKLNTVMFNPVVGFIKLNKTELPKGCKTLKISTDDGIEETYDVPLSGLFEVDLKKEGKIIASKENSNKENKTIILNLNPENEAVYIPLPPSSYSFLSISSCDGDGETIIRQFKDLEMINGYLYQPSNEINETLFCESLKKYWSTNFKTAEVTSVSLNTSNQKLTIEGNCPEIGKFQVCEIMPHQNLTLDYMKTVSYDITNGHFSLELDRFVSHEGLKYDRILSKWAIVKVDGYTKELVSSARYVNDLSPVPETASFKLESKKGMGGVSPDLMNAYSEDMVKLGVGSITYNIILNTLISSKQISGSIPYNYGGKTYYIKKNAIDKISSNLDFYQKHSIKVAAILLVSPKNSDEEIQNLFCHPRYSSKGIYTMPNMTTAESINCYAAILNYLASEFSSSATGIKIHHWIMHNEVDAGEVWTNMGDQESTPIELYLDTYMKSLRLAYNIIRQYNNKSEVFASFTHHWSQDRKGTKDYAPQNMLSRIVEYAKLEGDFPWALAYHSYPQDLRNPRTWNDQDALFNMNTKFITFKNLEVLGKWINMPEHKLNGVAKRSLWLSENGINTMGDNGVPYTDKGELLQAAGTAYSMKKVIGIDGIDAIIWHRWVDHPQEGGLRMGLRRFNDDKYKGGIKPSYYVFQSVGTENEDIVLNKYLDTIGIKSYDEIFNQVQ